MELNKMLFSGKDTMEYNSALKIGMCASPGTGCSAARPASARGNAKLNAAAYAVDLLLTGKLNALYSSNTDTLYVEYQTKNAPYRGFLSNQAVSGITFFDRVSESPVHQAVPLFLYALAEENGRFPETKSVFREFVREWKANPDTDRIFELCDAFYYEAKAVFMADITIQGSDTTSGSNEHELKIMQAIRTGEMVPVDEIQDVPNLPKFKIAAIEAVAPAKPKDDADDKFRAIKDGAFILDHMWDLERLSYIPELSTLDDFIPSRKFFKMLDIIRYHLGEVRKRMDDPMIGYGVKAIGNNYVNMMMVGRPGTGKTAIANALGAALGMPVRVVTNTKNTEEDNFQGMTKVQEGGFTFVPTSFLDVYKNGGILLLEEFNLADPGVMMGALGQALEKPFILEEDGYREVRRHPLCVCIATMNTGTEGSREPSQAFTSRIPNAFLLDDPDAKQFVDILACQSKQSRKTCEKVYKIYTKILDYLNSPQVREEEVALSVTLRHCLAALTQVAIGSSIKEAIEDTMIGTIGIRDNQLARDVYDHVVAVMPD